MRRETAMNPIGPLDRGLLDPAREQIAAAELVGFPGRGGVHAMQGHAQRIRWSMRIQSPPCRRTSVCMGHLGVHGIARHRERDRERLERRRVERACRARGRPGPTACSRAARCDRSTRVAARSPKQRTSTGMSRPSASAKLPDDDSRATVECGGYSAGQEEGFHERSVPPPDRPRDARAFRATVRTSMPRSFAACVLLPPVMRSVSSSSRCSMSRAGCRPIRESRRAAGASRPRLLSGRFLGVDPILPGEQHRALDEVLELAHVPGHA